MNCLDKVLLLLMLIFHKGSCEHCRASILEGPAQLVEQTTGSHVVFSCRALGAEDPRARFSPCNHLFNDGILNRVRLFWEVEGLGLHFSEPNVEPLQFKVDGLVSPILAKELELAIQDRGITISSDCPNNIDLSVYERNSRSRLDTERSNFCLSELSCTGNITIPASRCTNLTAVRCGVYSLECRDNPLDLESFQIYHSTSGMLIVKESLLELEVSQDLTAPGVLCVRCVFTVDSTAVGCHVTVEDLTHLNGIAVVLNISVVESMARGCISGLREGQHQVSAVEIDTEGVTGTQILFQTVAIEKVNNSATDTTNISFFVVGLSAAGGVLVVVSTLTAFTIWIILSKRKNKLSSGDARTASGARDRRYSASGNETVHDIPNPVAHEYDYPVIPADVWNEHDNSIEESGIYVMEIDEASSRERSETQALNLPNNYQNVNEQRLYENGSNETQSYYRNVTSCHERVASDDSYLVVLADKPPIGYSMKRDNIVTTKCVAYDSSS